MAQHEVNAFQNMLTVVGIKTYWKDRDPLVSDIDFRIPTLWINSLTNTSFLLISNENGVAVWALIGGGVRPTQAIDFYAANTAPPALPTSGDVYILDTTLPVDAGWTTIGASNNYVVQYGVSGWLAYAPTQGQIIYNSTIADFYIYNGTGWELLSSSTTSVTYVTFARAPMTSDNGYIVPTIWIDSALKESWILADITAGIANWLKLSSNTLGDAQDSCLAIVDGNNPPPTEVLGNRYIITDGGGGVVHAFWDGASFNDICMFDGASWVARTPNEGTFCEIESNNTVYIFTTSWGKLFQYTGASFVTDSGTANPDSTGVLNVKGVAAQGISTSGATNVLTVTAADATVTTKGVVSLETADFNVTAGAVELKDTVVKTVTTDSGALTPSGHSFSILGGEGVDVTHSGETITVAGEDASTTNKGILETSTDGETQLGASSAVAVVPSSLNSLMALSNLTGFYSWSDAGVYYSVAGTTFTLERGGVGYIKSKKVTWSGSQSTAALVKGATYWIYIDSTGTIGSTSTRTDGLFEDNIILFEVLVDNNVVPNVIVVCENHPYDYPVHPSNHLHRILHATLEGSGAIMSIVDTDKIAIVGADVLHDHGLETAISDSAGAAVTFSFMLTDAGGKYIKDSAATAFPSKYNNAGTFTALGATKYGVYRTYVSKSSLNSATPTYYALAHTAEFNNLSAALTGISDGVAYATNEFASLELAQLGYVIYSAATSSIVQIVIARSVIGVGTATASTNSAALISTSITDFDGWLGPTNTNQQSVNDTLDDMGKDSNFNIRNTASPTKQMSFSVASVTAGNNRVITMADQDINLTPTTGSYQASDQALTDISGLAVTDGNIIVGDGTNWVAESGSTARTSLGLGTIATQAADSVNIDGGNIDGTVIGATTPAAATMTTMSATAFDGAYTIGVPGGWVSNLGMTYAASTLSITAADGSALSADNPGYVVMRSKANPLVLKKYTITANQGFIDDTGASEIIGNLFGWTTGVAITTKIPFYVYAVTNDDEDAIAFMICRIPGKTTSIDDPAKIAAPDDPVATRQGDFFSFENIDETKYDTNPCLMIGSFRMTMSVADDWTVDSTFINSDGIGGFQAGTIFIMPLGQKGATADSYIQNNGGTAPQWAEQNYYYYIDPFTGFVSLQFNFKGDGGTEGAGAVTTRIILPFRPEVYVTTHMRGGGAGYIAAWGCLAFSLNDNVDYATMITSETGGTVTNGQLTGASRALSGSILYHPDISS